MAISCAEMITSNIQVVDLITYHYIYAVKARSLEKFQVEVIPCETKIVHHLDLPCEFLCTWLIYEFTRTSNAFTFTYKSCIGFEIKVCLSKLLFLQFLWGRILHGTKCKSKNIKLCLQIQLGQKFQVQITFLSAHFSNSEHIHE